MLVLQEMDFYEIKETSWDGAVETAQKIYDAGKETEFEQLIEECYPEGIDRIHLNDILRFDADWVFKQLRITEDDEEESEEDGENE